MKKLIKCLLGNHHWLRSEDTIPLYTKGCYSKGNIRLEICYRCSKIKGTLIWTKIDKKELE